MLFFKDCGALLIKFLAVALQGAGLLIKLVPHPFEFGLLPCSFGMLIIAPGLLFVDRLGLGIQLPAFLIQRLAFFGQLRSLAIKLLPDLIHVVLTRFEFGTGGFHLRLLLFDLGTLLGRLGGQLFGSMSLVVELFGAGAELLDESQMLILPQLELTEAML